LPRDLNGRGVILIPPFPGLRM